MISGTVGLILIGDELLNGSRQDKHLPKVIQLLKERGLTLRWVRIIGDSEAEISAHLKQTSLTNDIVFSFGGIGATPDDLTRASAAKAFNKKLVRHEGAKKLIEERFQEHAYPHRILMSDLPEGCQLIPNPVNQVPGFSLENHHFVPGFPDMAWPMVEWVLDNNYADYFNPLPNVEWRWDILGVPESSLLDLMNQLLTTFPTIKLSSLPSTLHRGDLIDFGIKGPLQDIEKAAPWLEQHLKEAKINFKFRGTTD